MSDSGVRKELEKLMKDMHATTHMPDCAEHCDGDERFLNGLEALFALQADKAVQDELSRLLAHFDNNPVELSVISDRLAGLKGEGWGSPMSINKPPKVASENTLRERLDNLLDNYYDGNNSIIIPADEDFGNQLLQAFTAAVETALITELEQVAKMNGATKVPSPLVAEYVSERLAEMVGTSAKMAQHVHKSKEGESLE